jgi:hypothetical protein
MSHPARGPARSVGIDSKANHAGRRHHGRLYETKCQEAAR